MSFSYIAGDWNIFVDDMDTAAVSENIGAATSQLASIYVNKITADYDGFMYIENIDNVPHRLKFDPISGASFTANMEQNPTFMAYEDGSFSFCLAAAV